MKNPIVRILILAAATLLSACTSTGGLALGPLKARVCYINAAGQRVCLASDGKEVNLEGDIGGSRSLGDGKAVIEFRTGN